MPLTLKEIMETESAHAATGTPCAGGLMDVVHIPLGACPHGLINVCTGKEGCPTLGCIVICDHSGQALALMPGRGACGTIIVKSDEAVEKAKNDKLFREFQCQVHRPDDGQSFFTKEHV